MRVGKGPIVLTAKDRKALESWVDRPGVQLRFIIRAWIVLLSASGHSTGNVASRLGVSASTVLYWRNRFLSGGIAEISKEEKISKPRHGDAEIRTIIEATEKQFPANARRWSIRNMAKFTGISRSTIQRIWKRHGLKPSEPEFKLTHDPQFFEKCKEIAGVYIQSDHLYAIALLADIAESPPRAQSSGLDGDSSLMIRVSRVLTRPRKAVRSPKPEMIDFFKWVDSYTPPGAYVHLIVPRRSMTAVPHAFRWLKRHPRFQSYIIPREIPARKFLGDWYDKTCRAAETQHTFANLPDLKRSMREYLDRNEAVQPALRKVKISNPFAWVRPDRNYQAAENQLELDLTAAS